MELGRVAAKQILTRGGSPAWFACDFNMNLYRGCTHGCIYCDSRSACYQNPDFDLVKEKTSALILLRGELARVRTPGVVATGAMSDPYNPFEATRRLTRGALELLCRYGFGVAVATKSPLITRDIDVYTRMARRAPVLLKMTITCARDDLAAVVEPGAAPSSARFAAVKALRDAGLCAGLLMMPLLPFLNDTEENVLSLVAQAQEAGAGFIYPAFGMTLREGNREYFYRALDRHFPGLKQQYAQAFGLDYMCPSPHAQALRDLLGAACDQAGIAWRMKDIIALYRGASGQEQTCLF